jgi:hypothetical protein
LDPGEPAHSLKSKVKWGYEILKAGGQFRILGVGRVETLHHQESQNHEMRNTEIPKVGGQFQIPGVGRVETLHHQESRNHEMRNPENPKQAHRLEVQIPRVGGVKSRDSSTQESRSVEMKNAKNPETGTSTGVSDTGSWRSQESRLFITGVPKSKCEMPKHLFV